MFSDIKVVAIENVFPEINAGKYPAKTEINEEFEVYADIFKDGHDEVAANLLFRKQGEKKWQKTPMIFLENDRWVGKFLTQSLGLHEYTIEAYPVENKDIISTYDKILKVYADRVEARFAAWYEMWPRSQGTIPNQSATFNDMENRLPEIKDMGFNVVYLTPIHPIGKSFRKGKNNSFPAKKGEPGSTYCIGNEHGGHKAVEPSLGTLEEFRHFVDLANKMDMEIALDIALNCSFDHPYLKEHPEWFFKNPDGSIKYAENPPKKYQDVYPLNFFTTENREELWKEMESMFLFWVEQGVKTFRIDNPHTKPFLFWEWVIKEVQKKHPDVLFLSEAFTRPKVMKLLAKSGFTQSYTYFTWRNHKHELMEYLTELTQSEVKTYMRGNLFTNTPDILPEILQKGGRAAFKTRFILAATLSSVYGIYNGFELIENKAIPGKEEYLNSEKYEYKVWDWNRPGHIKDLITKVNRIRKEHKALQAYDNLKFHYADNEHIIFYGKFSKDLKDVVFVVVNLDPFNNQGSMIYMPIEELGIGHTEIYEVRDLITNQIFTFRGKENYIELDPTREPAHILTIERWLDR